MGIRYGRWSGGPDPLAPPYDIRAAAAEIGDDVLAGATPREALAALLRRGAEGRRGLDDLLRAVRERRREARRAGRLDGTLEEVRELLDRAVAQERQALFPDPSDDARLREHSLDDLPHDTARAVRELASYDWQSPLAAATYEELRDLLRREVLDQRVRGLKDALDGAGDAGMHEVAEMLRELNDLLDADARGEDTTEALRAFLDRHGQHFPDDPQSVDELVDSLARRARAAEAMAASLTPQQRQELADLQAQALARDPELALQAARLDAALRARRPDLLGGRQRGERIGGEQSLGLGDATTVLEELADLEGVEAALAMDGPGASLEDVDVEALERALGRSAVEDLRALRALERELSAQGYLTRGEDDLELSPKAVREIGARALARVFSQLETRGRGAHDVRDAGAAGEPTGASRPWAFGDEAPLDVARTLRNAVQRGGRASDGSGRVTLAVEDWEVVETERRTGACVVLCVDLSYSMALRGTWGAAKTTALALHSLVSTRYPQDALHLVGFSDHARELDVTELAGLSWDPVQGTNLQHALLLSERLLRRHPQAEPVVLVITDGEPTAHLTPDGHAQFHWPPLPETVEATLVEVLRLTRRGATINVFMLDEEPRLVAFVDEVARLNGGRVFSATADRLGEHVVTDYLDARGGRRR